MFSVRQDAGTTMEDGFTDCGKLMNTALPAGMDQYDSQWMRVGSVPEGKEFGQRGLNDDPKPNVLLQPSLDS